MPPSALFHQAAGNRCSGREEEGDGGMGGEEDEDEERVERTAAVRWGQLGMWRAELVRLYRCSPLNQRSRLAALLHNSSYVTTYGCASTWCVFLTDIHASLGRQSFWNPKRLQRGQLRLISFLTTMRFQGFVFNMLFHFASLPSGSALSSHSTYRPWVIIPSHVSSIDWSRFRPHTFRFFSLFSREACEWKYEFAKRVGTQVSWVSEDTGCFVSEVSESLCEFAACWWLVG